MSIVLHNGCRAVSTGNVRCELWRDHGGGHEARTAEGKVMWHGRALTADATPPLRHATPTVPDVRA
jgi:hypothetical protein